MAGKTTFISLGPAALEILRLDKKYHRQEAYNTPEAQQRRLHQRLIREGSYYYDEDEDIEYLEDELGNLYEMTQEDYEYRARKEEELAETVARVYEKTLLYLADYTPVDTGNLFDSIYSECTDKYFKIGFDMHKAPYAVYQHEDTTLHHVNGRAKFLQQAFLEAAMVADPKRHLEYNITIKGLHDGGILEVQAGEIGRGNLDTLLKKASSTSEFIEEAKTGFNHDFWSDIDTTVDIMHVFEKTDLLDVNALNEYMSNRRMFGKTLGKTKESDLQSLLNNSIAANDGTSATAALAALLMKRRQNHRKSMAKLQLASQMGWGRDGGDT